MEEPLWRSRRLSSWSLAAQYDAPVKRIGAGSLPERNPTVARGCVELSCTHAEIGGGIVLSDYAAVIWPRPPASRFFLPIRVDPPSRAVIAARTARATGFYGSGINEMAEGGGLGRRRVSSFANDNIAE
jgi:hypothetical protein